MGNQRNNDHLENQGFHKEAFEEQDGGPHERSLAEKQTPIEIW
jgi:hypothetical protein